MNEHDKNEETRKDQETEELTTSVPPPTQDKEAHATDDESEDSLRDQSPDEAIDEDDTSTASDGIDSDEPLEATTAELPQGETARAHQDASEETGEPQIVRDSTAEGESGTVTTTDSESPGDSDTGAQPTEEGSQRCPCVPLQAGTDEQSLKALALCREKVKQLHLKMRPLAARYEGEKHVTIYFRADDKVDFRKLVRELSRLLHARIELRQVGPREQGKLCGLLGKCGYPLCCRTFLGPLTQSTIKMAKTQELALNPMKISGVCGRLLCCLNYEQEMYVKAKSRMPKVNRIVETEFGPGKVIAVNVLKDTVTVQLETVVRELHPEQVHLPESHE